MRRTILFLLGIMGLLGAAQAVAQTPTPIPITGNLGAIQGVGQPYAGVQILLQNCPSPVSITGYFGIVQQGYQIRATSSGLITGTIWPNDLITCNGTTGNSQYSVTLMNNGTPSGTRQCYQVTEAQTIWNMNTQQPISCSAPPPNPQDAQFRNLNVTGCFSVDGEPCGGLANNLLTTKGDIFGFSTVPARIPVGADGTVLTADSTQALGVKWATPSGGGGLSGQTIGCAPQAASGTTSTSSLPLCLVGGVLTSTDPFAAPSLISGTPSSGALAALPTGAHGISGDESSTASIGAAGVGVLRFDSTFGLVFRSGTAAEYPVCTSANIVSGACSGSGGFPFTLGSTSIAASSSNPALTGLSINGVTLDATGTATNYLDKTGAYSTPVTASTMQTALAGQTGCTSAGNFWDVAANTCHTASGLSVKIKYVSVAGCAQNTDLTAGGGTDATSCINALWSGASPTNPILVYQDGASLISGNGLQMPAGGGAFLQGNGGGVATVGITNSSLTSNVATFTTQSQTPLLAIGQNVQLQGLSNASALNGAVVTVLSTGLSSTQFEANYTHADISSGAETGTGSTVYGTGFYLASSSGDAVSNGVTPSAGSCDTAAGAVPSRGAGFGVSNLVINGNSAGQTNYCFVIDLNDANNIGIDNVTFYNAAHYATKMANVGQVKVTRSSFIAAQAYLGAPVNTDGIHMEGPWNDLVIANDYFNTGDDAIALNASEGYCGPGIRTEITNSTAYSSRSMLRAYNNGAVCGNGLTPLISTVNISNYSGSVYNSVASLGFNTIGALNPAITDFSWSNSTVEALGSANGIVVTNNLGRVDFDTFTLKNGGCLLCSNVGSQSIATLGLHGVKLVSNDSSSFIYPLGVVAGGGTLQVTTAIVGGLGEYNDAGGTTSAGCPFCGTGTVTNLYASNIDMNLFNTFADSHVTNLEGQAGGDIWAYPAGFVNGNTAIHMKNGLTFTPEVSAGGAHTYFEDTSVSHNVFVDFDNNNRTATINSGTSGSPIAPLTLTSASTDSTRFLIGNTSSGSHNYLWDVTGSSYSPSMFFYDLTAGKEFLGMGENGSTPYVQLPTLGVLGFASGTVYGSTPDTGLSRPSAGVVDVGNGAQGDKSGTVNAATYGAGALANGMTATTQSPADNSTKVATTAYADAAAAGSHFATSHFWNVQGVLFATSTMLGAVDYAPFNGDGYNAITARLSGTISCSVAPVVQIMDLGVSPSTAYGSATAVASITTGTSDGVYASSSPTWSTVAGHYYGVAFSAGTCVTAPTFDIAGNW